LAKYFFFKYRGADEPLVRPDRKQAAATEHFDVHISYLLSYLEEYYNYLYITRVT